MKIDLVRIGNSKGIRLPKAVIEQCGLEGGIEMAVRGQEIVLKAARTRSIPRAGWSQGFADAASAESLLGDFPNAFDDAEWSWPDRAKRK